LPDGAGLSSSAALEVLTTYFLLELSGQEMSRPQIARFCQKVENEFVKVSCGIMDQFSVAMGKENSAILLNCTSLEYQYIPLDLENYSLVIMNTNKKRELASSKYNERKKECDNALALLNEFGSFPNLCAAPIELAEKLKDPILKKRALHVISENQRVLEAVDALKNKDIAKFGALLTSSHLSLQHYYEVSGLELDTIVLEALKIKGCIGARMTGAGFGGCALALVEKNEVEIFKQKLSAIYYHKTHLIPSFYESKISDGVKEILAKSEILS
ncbi:MAG: galactokinase, partial [Flavobacteriales bacterium]